MIDTYGLSRKIHDIFYVGYHNVKLPHKFKIAVGGCPNNCVKPDLNDLGIVGQRIIKRDLEKCRGCKKCQVESACPIKIAQVEAGKLTYEGCNNCGRCVGKCPFGVTDEYKLEEDMEEVLKIVEKCILLFKEQGVAGERFADTVARIGFENVQTRLLSDEILNRKEEILK